MTGPGELALTATAIVNSKGEIPISMAIEQTISLARFKNPLSPLNGVSQTEMTSTPHTSLNQISDEHVWHKIYGRRGVFEAVEDFQYSGLRAHGQGQVNRVDPLLFDIASQILDFSEHGEVVCPADAARCPVVKKSEKICARIRRRPDLLRKSDSLPVHAHDDHPARRNLRVQRFRTTGPNGKVRACL